MKRLGKITVILLRILVISHPAAKKHFTALRSVFYIPDFLTHRLIVRVDQNISLLILRICEEFDYR